MSEPEAVAKLLYLHVATSKADSREMDQSKKLDPNGIQENVETVLRNKLVTYLSRRYLGD
jgi:hypothetical protein